ncbi:MAG: hypothetical protein ABII82_11460 [Verrucomicrobiota bacterium]
MITLRFWMVCRIIVIGLGLVAGAGLRAAKPSDLAADLGRIHLEAIGGREKVDALQAIRATGTIRIAGAALDFVMWAQRPDRVRVETVGGEVRITRGYDGVNPPWIRLGDVKTKVQSETDGADFVRDAEFDDPFYDPESRGVALNYEGVVEVHGLKWSRVRATGPRGESLLYLDEAGMLVRRDQARFIRGREVVEETYYSDFRPVGGVLLPHLVEVRVGNNVLHETTLTKIEPNPFLLEGFFSAR